MMFSNTEQLRAAYIHCNTMETTATIGARFVFFFSYQH